MVEGKPRDQGGLTLVNRCYLYLMEPSPRVTAARHRLRWRMVRAAAVGILLPVLLLAGCQSRLIYHPQRYHAQVVAHPPAGLEPLRYRVHGHELVAFYRHAEPMRRLWVLFNGNAGLALHWAEFVRESDPRDAYLLIDYPGYGASGGSPSPASIRAGADGALSAVAARIGRTPAELSPRLAVLGHSLGAAAALQFAAGHEVERVVLISPFTSLMDMARRMVGRPLCWLLTHRFDNRARLAELRDRPRPPRVAIVHGDADEVIPVAMGRELAASWPAIAYREIAGADHNGIIDGARTAILAAMHDD